jgi:DNA polymerase I-like protein with 3'-5' exonuclease and polymerase domains
MFTAKHKTPSTALEHFLMLSNQSPKAGEFMGYMKEYSSAGKMLGTYIDGFLNFLRPDGKFHPTYMLHRGEYKNDKQSKDAGTVTGRTSAKDPAYQTIPKHTVWAKPLRKVYVPPPNHVILKADYSQGELRIAADVANEPTMIQSYTDGIDLHSVTAARLVNMELSEFLAQPKEWQAEKRFGGKAGNFGLLYGMGAEGFQMYALNTYGVELSLEECHEFRDGFFELYPRLLEWHDEQKEYAAKHGYVRSPLGRIRHLPLIKSHFQDVRAKQERQAINSPIQATLSDMAQLSIVLLTKKYPDLWIFGMTHDDIAFYVPENETHKCARRIKHVMENLPLEEYFGWVPKVKFVADVEVGVNNLAELTDLSL